MIDERKKADLYNTFENADTILLKKYVSTLNKLSVIKVSESIVMRQIIVPTYGSFTAN